MPLKTKQHGQFIVLMAGDIDINPSSTLRHIIGASQYNDMLMHIETTQFDLILLDLTANSSAASQLIRNIKDPMGINHTTPVIAIVNPEEDPQIRQQYAMKIDDTLIKPITEERLNEILDLWQTKTLALGYIQILMNKTKNNQRLTLTIFEKLFEELPQQIIDIKNALDNKQYELAKEVTHKLHGSVSFCGLIDIQQPASALESCLLNSNYADTCQHFLTLQQCTLNFTRHQQFILTNLGKYKSE